MSSLILIACLFASLVGLMVYAIKQAKTIAMYKGWNERLQDENRKLKAMANVNVSHNSDDELWSVLQKNGGSLS